VRRSLILGIDERQYRTLSEASKREVDLTEGALIRRRAGIADDRDRTILAYSRFSPNVPSCHHAST